MKLILVQAALGHKNLGTTAIYTQPSQEDIEKAVDKTLSDYKKLFSLLTDDLAARYEEENFYADFLQNAIEFEIVAELHPLRLGAGEYMISIGVYKQCDFYTIRPV